MHRSLAGIRNPFFLAATIITAAGPIVAQEGAMVAIYGAGQKSCGTWLVDRLTPLTYQANRQWVLGYLTAFNVYGLKTSPNIAGSTDAESFFAWIDNYCGAHPTDKLQRATASLINQLKVDTRAE
jgi:hypothetical protein